MRPGPATPALELRAVGKTYGRTRILDSVSLAIAAGERVALIGPNGAGKSTLFDLASGRHRCSAGEIRLQGRRIDGLAPFQIHRLGLARSFQVSSLFGRLTAFENLRCAALCGLGHGHVWWRRLSSLRDARARAEEVLARIGLETRRDQLAMRLGYAEQRVLEIGIAIVGGAGVILLDEPTAGMSRSESARCVELVRAVSQGKTLLMVEHDMSVVFGLADRIAVLAQGTLMAFDTPDRVRADPRVQEAYLGLAGKSAANRAAGLDANPACAPGPEPNP
jgi:branched-chain amino acid transport system ATP-binding protein